MQLLPHRQFQSAIARRFIGLRIIGTSSSKFTKGIVTTLLLLINPYLTLVLLLHAS